MHYAIQGSMWYYQEYVQIVINKIAQYVEDSKKEKNKKKVEGQEQDRASGGTHLCVLLVTPLFVLPEHHRWYTTTPASVQTGLTLGVAVCLARCN